jgi:DNA-binding response OmpR family regulator
MDKDPRARPASATELFVSLRDARRAVVKAPAALRILVADADASFGSFVSEVLQFGFPDAVVEIVADGDSAMRALERVRFDVVFVELELPKLNGLELVAAVRGAGRRDRPRLLVTTAVGSAGDWNVLVSLGVDAFLLKPVRREHLLRSVQGMASRTRGAPAGT